MKQYFIIGYKKRYSIREDGNVIRHYRFQNNGKKRYEDVILSKHLNTKQSTSCSVSLAHPDGKTKTVIVNTLMVKYFKITPPDDQHCYEIHHVNGDIYDNSLKNLEFKHRLLSRFKFEPKCFYSKGEIIAKVCVNCGEKRTINKFTFSSDPNHKGSRAKRKTYRNKCNYCTTQENWNRIKTNPKSRDSYIRNSKKWIASEKGRKFHLDYNRMTRKELTPSYLNKIISKRGGDPSLYTEGMKEILKLQIRIQRELRRKKITTQQGI